MSHLSLLILTFLTIFVQCSSFQQSFQSTHMPKLMLSSRISSKLQMALEPEHYQQLETITKLLENLTEKVSDPRWMEEQDDKSLEEAQQQVSGYKTILRSADTLREVEKDIELCRLQMSSDDESIREKAQVFHRHFSEIYESLEMRVIALLSNSYMLQDSTIFDDENEESDDDGDDFDELEAEAIFKPNPK